MMNSTAATPENPWRERLYHRFRLRGTPALVAGPVVIPAASLWVGIRLWVDALRAWGVGPGTRVVLALPPCSAFVQVLIAGLWERLTLFIADPLADLERTRLEADAALVIAATGHGTLIPEPEGTPPTHCPPRVAPRYEPCAEARLLLRSSGTTRIPRWIALSDVNVLAVLDSHLPLLPLEDRRMLSALPWHHAFGLVLDLLAGLMAGAIVVRDTAGGRDPEGLLRLAREWECDWLSGVPLLFRRLRETAGGEAFLKGLSGGIVGGTAVDAGLARFLAETRLRAGYGQTEASPGIALGEPGAWQAGFLGRPVGCQIRFDPDGRLFYRGPNACLGEWAEGLRRADPERWVDSSDLVDLVPEGLRFRGRADDRFKLDNGRFICASEVERLIREASPGVPDLLLGSLDGEHLSVWWTGPEAPDLNPARQRLGSVGTRLRIERPIPPDLLVRSPKGEILRCPSLERIRDFNDA